MPCPLVTISKATEMIHWVLIDVSLVYVKILLIFFYAERDLIMGNKMSIKKKLKMKAKKGVIFSSLCFSFLLYFILSILSFLFFFFFAHKITLKNPCNFNYSLFNVVVEQRRSDAE